MTKIEQKILDRVGGGVPFYKELGRIDGMDKSRKRMRSVTQNFKLAYTTGFFEGRKTKERG